MKLRGAISGFGEVAANAHLAGWRARENVSIGVIHDPIAERRHEAIRLIKNVRVYDDLELMLDGEALDFLDIASPPALHVAAARAALESGAHVLAEKPLCLSLTELNELLALAAAQNKVLMCVHNWKYAPSYALARILLDEGRIGDVLSASFDRLRVAPAGAGGAGGIWRASSASGGGILIDHGWHVFYLMQWLTGGEAPARVAANVTSNSDGVDEVARVDVAFPSGRQASAMLSWQATHRKTSASLIGTAGRLEIENERICLTAADGKVEEFPVQDMPDDSYHSAWFSGMASQFEAAIQEGPDGSIARSNLSEARNALALIAAARASAKNQGTPIDIES